MSLITKSMDYTTTGNRGSTEESENTEKKINSYFRFFRSFRVSAVPRDRRFALWYIIKPVEFISTSLYGVIPFKFLDSWLTNKYGVNYIQYIYTWEIFLWRFLLYWLRLDGYMFLLVFSGDIWLCCQRVFILSELTKKIIASINPS